MTDEFDPMLAKMNAEAEAQAKTYVPRVKDFRKALDAILQDLKKYHVDRGSLPCFHAITKLQESIMWCGMELKDLKEAGLSEEPNPYPKSYDSSSSVVEPTADELKL